MARVISFSRVPSSLLRAPGSCPPCPASMTTRGLLASPGPATLGRPMAFAAAEWLRLCRAFGRAAARHWPRAGQMRSVRVSTPPRNPPHLHLPEKERSEEHTSELQSLMRISYAVFCLKKKRTTQDNLLTYNYYTIATTNIFTHLNQSM